MQTRKYGLNERTHERNYDTENHRMTQQPVTQINLTNEIQASIWFTQITELRSVGPGEVVGHDFWGVTADEVTIAEEAIDRSSEEEQSSSDIVALACVDPESGHVSRMAVKEPYRGYGIGNALIEKMASEYGPLEAFCRESLAANDFYAATGWEHVDVRVGDPENLNVWEYDPDT